MSSPRFASVVLDVDSTLCGIEGIDWLAARKDPTIAAEIAALTSAAMAGEVRLEDVYARRLDQIRPDADDINALAQAYRVAIAIGAADTVRMLRSAGVQLHLVSGGLREAIVPLGRDLGFRDSEIHAVSVRLDSRGHYVDFDRISPLVSAAGKRTIVAALDLPMPRLAVGDASTDAALIGVTESFAVFTGFVRREQVVRIAQHECRSFLDLLHLVLP